VTKISFTLSDSHATFIGDLTRQTVGTITKKMFKQLLSNNQLVVDFKQIERVDTAGLAWLLLLIEKANLAACQVKIINFPSDLAKLAKLSAVDTFLPID
jgi:phospholipid transport system transporter-binding protein